MDVKYINPFVISTKETFSKMLSIDLEMEKMYVKAANETSDITGIIGLSGQAKGIVAVTFSRITALRSVSVFLGMKCLTLDDTVSDAVGELINIIAGNAKQYLSDLNVDISLPKVIIGQGHSVAEMKEVPTVVIPFSSKLGEFKLEVALVKEK